MVMLNLKKNVSKSLMQARQNKATSNLLNIFPTEVTAE